MLKTFGTPLFLGISKLFLIFTGQQCKFNASRNPMCGRFSLTTEEKRLNEFFELSGGTAPYVPRYNGAPTQNLAVITAAAPGRLQYFRWGLIPGWSKTFPRDNPLINARAESVAEKPLFRQAFKQRRCLVPADGFYEWAHSGIKQAYRFVYADGLPFAMAGLWDEWMPGTGEPVRSFTILTTTPNKLMEPIHNRMPVILEKETFRLWLNGGDPGELLSLLKPYPEDQMKAYRVSAKVNSVKAEGPELILPVEDRDLFSFP